MYEIYFQSLNYIQPRVLNYNMNENKIELRLKALNFSLVKSKEILIPVLLKAPNRPHKGFILFLHNNCHPFIYHNKYYMRNRFIARWQLHHQAQHGQHQEKKGALF